MPENPPRAYVPAPRAKKPTAPKPKPEHLSPHSTEAAFDGVKAQLDALAQAAIRQPNFNLQEGALVAIAAHGLLATPERRATLEALADGRCWVTDARFLGLVRAQGLL